MTTEILRVTLTPKVIEKAKMKDRDNIPLCSFLHIYEFLGLLPLIESYRKMFPDYQLCPITDLHCNFYTLQFLKRVINSNWGSYDLKVEEDGKVVWDTKKYPKGKKHYEKKLRAEVRNSVNFDFANYCPGIDDELDDYVLVYSIETPDQEIKKDEEE